MRSSGTTKCASQIGEAAHEYDPAYCRPRFFLLGKVKTQCPVDPGWSTNKIGVELATIVHAGSHRSIDLAYGALATHVARYERPADGPLREHYLVGPLDTSDESAWRTEIESPSVLIKPRFQKPPVNLY
jgi:hypothetical protein